MRTKTERPAVTVVVPVYGDLPSLLDCVESLRAHVDTSRDTVLLVNDCGPEADGIERALLRAVEGVAGFRYERNEHNLGFVGTCNRAVQELDTSDNDILLLNSDTVTTPGFVEEMQDVLYASDDHGVVCARSNNATIASLPFRLTHSPGARSMDRTRHVFKDVSPLLPRWYVTPVAMGFCFLTRRTLIQRYGLFDDAFAPGYGEENDYCLRINEDGHLSVMANHALVLHAGSKSFVGVQRDTLRATHQKKLEGRYPFYADATDAFLRYGTSPADRFADVLVPEDLPARVAVDLRGAVAHGMSLSAVDDVVHRITASSPRGATLEIIADAEIVERMAAIVTRSARDDVTVKTDAHPDDIVAVGLFVAGTVTGDSLIEANRRYAAWGVIEIDSRPRRWSVDGPRAADLQASAAFESRADFSLTVRTGDPAGLSEDTTPWDAFDEAWRNYSREPLADRVARLTDRWSVIGIAEAVSRRSSAADARELRRYRDEIRDLRASRSYRVGNAIVNGAKRALRRPL